jgi:RNA polymerase sigma-70 factor (sigma-E family)
VAASSADEFADFAAAAAPRLRRTAFGLCGDWHTAEDLTQTALANVFVSWRRISCRDAAYAYASRTLVNAYLASKRRRHVTELALGRLPDAAAPPQSPELRLMILEALAALPPKGRAVVMLRYWEDLSIDEVAGLLGCSPGNVKSQSSRSLSKLRELLDGAVTAPPEPGRQRVGLRHG